jgi:small-conductance mechanosensitive channel
MAAVVIVIGYLTGNFLGRTALIASVNAGLAISSLLGKFVKYTVFFIALSMALELLGIGKDTVLVAFAIVMGGVVLALAIAFGHGGRAAAERYIEKRLKEKEEEKDEIEHI